MNGYLFVPCTAKQFIALLEKFATLSMINFVSHFLSGLFSEPLWRKRMDVYIRPLSARSISKHYRPTILETVFVDIPGAWDLHRSNW